MAAYDGQSGSKDRGDPQVHSSSIYTQVMLIASIDDKFICRQPSPARNRAELGQILR